MSQLCSVLRGEFDECLLTGVSDEVLGKTEVLLHELIARRRQRYMRCCCRAGGLKVPFTKWKIVLASVDPPVGSNECNRLENVVDLINHVRVEIFKRRAMRNPTGSGMRFNRSQPPWNPYNSLCDVPCRTVYA